jgi:hypothetical protein
MPHGGNTAFVIISASDATWQARYTTAQHTSLLPCLPSPGPRYTEDPSYTPDIVAKQSRAAMSLCMWTRAMEVYNRWAAGAAAAGWLEDAAAVLITA